MPTEADRTVLAGRLAHYLGKMDDAIAILSDGVERFPDDPRFPRHRGHRYLTARRPHDALADLERAAAMIAGTEDEHEFFQPRTAQDLIDVVLGREPAPQRLAVTPETIRATRGQYKSTLHVSVHYHLGIARYLLADWDGAFAAFRDAAAAAIDDDMRAAAADWSYLSARRAGRDDDARSVIGELGLDALEVEPSADFYLHRLRAYRGETDPASLLEDREDDPLAVATHGYAVGTLELVAGRTEVAAIRFERVVRHGAYEAFGRIAAEAELSRLRPTD